MAGYNPKREERRYRLRMFLRSCRQRLNLFSLWKNSKDKPYVVLVICATVLIFTQLLATQSPTFTARFEVNVNALRIATLAACLFVFFVGLNESNWFKRFFANPFALALLLFLVGYLHLESASRVKEQLSIIFGVPGSNFPSTVQYFSFFNYMYVLIEQAGFGSVLILLISLVYAPIVFAILNKTGFVLAVFSTAAVLGTFVFVDSVSTSQDYPMRLYTFALKYDSVSAAFCEEADHPRERVFLIGGSSNKILIVPTLERVRNFSEKIGFENGPGSFRIREFSRTRVSSCNGTAS
jgi:hypothetical protein